MESMPFDRSCDTPRKDIPAAPTADTVPQANAALPHEGVAMVYEDAPFFAKWLTTLFWLSLAKLVIGFIASRASGLFGIAASALDFAVVAALAYVFWRLAAKHARFRIVAIMILVSNLASFALDALFPAPEGALALILLAAILALSLYADFHQYTALSEITLPLSPERAKDWRELWKWTATATALLFGGMALGFLAAFLVFLSLLGTIAIAIVSIVQLVYLYRTAKLFQARTAPMQSAAVD